MGKTILFVLLTMAKILGIILLVLLLLLLAILFVAVRYHVDSRLESRMAKGCISWLGFVVRIPFRSEGGTAVWKLRVLGIPIMSSRRKKNTDNKKAGRGRRKKADQTEKEHEPDVADAPLPAGEKATEKEAVTEGKTSVMQSDDGGMGAVELEETLPEHMEESESQEGFFHRIVSRCRRLREKIKEAGQQLAAWIRAVWDAFRMGRKKAASLQDLSEILRSEHGRAFICILKDNVLHLLGQLRPKKVKGDIVLGLGDPCITGEMLGVLAVIYAWIGTGIKVTPDFMEKRFEGRIQMWGRLRIITLICIALRIIRNKEGKKLQKELQKWKEDF